MGEEFAGSSEAAPSGFFSRLKSRSVVVLIVVSRDKLHRQAALGSQMGPRPWPFPADELQG